MSEWRKVRVDEIAEKISIGPFGSRMKSDTYTEIGVPVIRGTNLTGGRSFSGEWVYISEEDADQLASCNVTEGDLVFPHRGAIGEVGIVPGDRDRYLLSSSLMKLKCDPKKAHSLYIFYFFKSHEGRHQLLKNASQVGTPGIGQPLSSLKSIELELPPLNNQRAIAHILGTLDDKIELNRRINETLEAIARAMFKSWFVDFDPVRAKMSGELLESICQRLGLTPDLFALFPDRLVDSELGDGSTSLTTGIPEGWAVWKIERLLSRLSTKTRYTKDEVAPYGAVPVFEQGASILLGYHNGTAQFSASADDPAFIFGDHTCVTHLACEPFDISQNVIPLRGADRPTLWVYYAVRDKQVFQEYRRHWMELVSKDVVVPPELICKEFAQIVSSLHLDMESNVRQNRELMEIRDTLLPKLLSGELRVPETESTLEALI